MCLACLNEIGNKVSSRMVDFGCSASAFDQMRRQLLPLAKGAVVEIGIGSGRSLPFYDASKIVRLTGIEPDADMRRRAQRALQRVSFPVDVVADRAEALPIATGTIDTVVLGYVLCSVTSTMATLREAARVLKPGGRLIFCEHARSDSGLTGRAQRRLGGAWARVAGGCRLSNDPLTGLENAGFRCRDLSRGHFRGPLALLGQNLGGWAIPSDPGLAETDHPHSPTHSP